MSGTITYRTATMADVGQLITLGQLAYGAYAPYMSAAEVAAMHNNIGNPDMWERLLSTSAGFVALADDAIVGMAFLVPSGNPWDIFLADWSYIRMVGVHPGFQGRGIARTLMLYCLRQARANGEKVIALHTSEKMDAARHLYEDMGFTILKEIPMRLGMRYWLYILTL